MPSGVLVEIEHAEFVVFEFYLVCYTTLGLSTFIKLLEPTQAMPHCV